ncbi:Sec-independent protein translocase protein TatB [Iodobacter fluviatilis]|uniref:Sec-independent protein translocase protein TatB n=1 Tax=Iodobacter fluviatilis TaxID=537 RepID=A0A377SV98_9NEIS|nr:Sec-independent protein translocase protein TatB [Iodobacter fluviatilis]TCU85645.1 Sec-independent protein translocase TatB [Iodobacter fluviatilis]STR44907.1 Sec-independent protein translocase protein TatB [Iodobacter fluviatilis]
MFDVSFGELITISAVALIVIGPEKLPKVARTAGALLGRVQRFISTVKSDLDKEFQLAELAKVEAEIRAEASALSQTIHQPLEEAAQALSEPAPIQEIEHAPAGPQGDLFAPPAAPPSGSRPDRR